MSTTNQQIQAATTAAGDPNAGKDALAQYTSSAVSSAMPSFYQALQGVRESAVRRGISTGDLGTSYEGDLASAFQKNVQNEAGSHALDLYKYNNSNYLDLLSGQRDYETGQANAKRQRKSGLFGSIGSVLGGVGGFLAGEAVDPFGGGIAGAAAGSKIGGSAGAAIGGY